MKTILVTGGAGFIGSNFIRYILNKYSSYNIVNLDKLTYAADLNKLGNASKKVSYSFFQGDVCDSEIVKRILSACKITDIVHFAAETHVDNSIQSANQFAKTNVMGTLNLLNLCKQFNNYNLIHISTDEVFGSLGNNGYFTEESSYNPRNPYSATKASADFLVNSYRETYGINAKIVNATNNYGPRQHKEKFIPTVIRNAISNNPIPIYGSGENYRDWIYVDDFCDAIDLVLHNETDSTQYVVGTNTERRNIDLAYYICEKLDETYPKTDKKSYKEQIQYVDDRLGHDFRYAIDSTKIKNELGWYPKIDFETGIIKTIGYYLDLWS